MPGMISSITVQPGQKVTAGEVLLSIEAMKMETAIHAEADGVVDKINVSVGSQVKAKDLLVNIDLSNLIRNCEVRRAFEIQVPALFCLYFAKILLMVPLFRNSFMLSASFSNNSGLRFLDLSDTCNHAERRPITYGLQGAAPSCPNFLNDGLWKFRAPATSSTRPRSKSLTAFSKPGTSILFSLGSLSKVFLKNTPLGTAML